MGKPDDKDALYESLPTEGEETSLSPGGSSELLVHARAVEEAPDPASPACKFQLVPGDLTWEDDFYKDEDDVVAVFDMDTKAIIRYQWANACKFLKLAALNFALLVTFAWVLGGDDSGNDVIVVFCCALFGVCIAIYLILVIAHCKKVGAAAGAGGIHMAITSDSICYDQDEPPLSTRIPLRSVIACTVAEKKFRKFTFSQEYKISITILHIAGAKPKSYVGIKQASKFQKLLVKLQQRQLNGSSTLSVV